MQRETVVRQNCCHREMNALLFLCFFLFMATQLFIGETGQETLVNAANMLLYLVFVPGFLFLTGYRVSMAFHEPAGEGKKTLLALGGRCFLTFFLMAMAQNMVLNRLPFTYSLAQVLTGESIPSLAAVFFAMGLLFLLAVLFYESLLRLSMNQKGMLLAGLFCLALGLISMGEGYALMGAFLRCESQAAIPVLPYGAFFLLGISFEEKKPGFQWRLLLGAAPGQRRFPGFVPDAPAEYGADYGFRSAGIPGLCGFRGRVGTVRKIPSGKAFLRTDFLGFCRVCGSAFRGAENGIS